MKTTIILLSLCLIGSLNMLAALTNPVPENADSPVTTNTDRHIFNLPALDGTTNTIPFELSGGVYSKPCSNIYSVFQSSIDDASYFPANKSIPFGFISATNYNYEVYILRSEYGYRILCKSEAGEQVKPTRLGARYGAKYDELKEYNNNALDWTVGNGNNANRPFWAMVYHDQPSLTRIFPPPDQLFNFDKPGKYTLWIELQCFARPYLPYPSNLYIVRLPAAKLQVIK
jgi:hypothetical protein